MPYHHRREGRRSFGRATALFWSPTTRPNDPLPLALEQATNTKPCEHTTPFPLARILLLRRRIFTPIFRGLIIIPRLQITLILHGVLFLDFGQIFCHFGLILIIGRLGYRFPQVLDALPLQLLLVIGGHSAVIARMEGIAQSCKDQIE